MLSLRHLLGRVLHGSGFIGDPGFMNQTAILTQIASIREVVLGAPLKLLLKHLASKTVAPNVDKLVALVHRPNESFFLAPQV